MEAVSFGAPKYLKTNGVPKTIADLEKHDFIVFSPTGFPLKWILKGPGGKKIFLPRGRLSVNHPLSLKEAALRGLGLAFLPSFMVAEEIRDKKLKLVCPDWKVERSLIHLVFPGQKFISPKVRAFIEHTTQHLSF